jgi:hypothetical protein
MIKSFLAHPHWTYPSKLLDEYPIIESHNTVIQKRSDIATLICVAESTV